MTFKLLNRVRMSVSGTAGTGAITVNLAAAGFQSFTAAGMSDGDTCPYVIEDGAPLGTDWEIGVGTWHSNGTFSRTTVTQSSLGGSTKISASSDAILSATLRASDLAGVGPLSHLTDVNITSPSDGDLLRYNGSTSKWENVAAGGGSAPTIVQAAVVHSTTAGDVNITLGSTPAQHNLLIAFGTGGGGSIMGVYIPGFEFALADKQIGASSQYDVGYGIRSARPSETSTFKLGSINSGGPGFAGAIVEVSGVDISRFTEWMVGKGSFSSTLGQVQALTVMNALSLFYGSGDDVTVTPNSPGSYDYNSSDGTTRLILAHDTAGGDWNGIAASISPNYNFGVLVLNLPPGV